MPNLGGADLSGEGRLLFAAEHSVSMIVVLPSTLAHVQYRSTQDPRRVMHGGWIALGYYAGGPGGIGFSRVRWHKYLEFEREEMLVQPSVICDGLHYLIPPGSAWFIDVYWDW